MLICELYIYDDIIQMYLPKKCMEIIEGKNENLNFHDYFFNMHISLNITISPFKF